MKLPQFFADIGRRNIRTLVGACVAAGWLLLQVVAVALAIFEAIARGMKLLIRTLGFGKAQAPVKRLDRSAKYVARSCHWRT